MIIHKSLPEYACLLGGKKSPDHMTSLTEYESKDMLHWKRGSAFVSSEDKNLWISSRPMWFDGP
ncbi:hypothetical protein LEMLEM_LOCUS16568 [Lemmus lemmus]